MQNEEGGEMKNMSANILVEARYPNDETSEVAQIYLEADTTLPSYIRALSEPSFRRTGGVD
jgi:hypothetical protein